MKPRKGNRFLLDPLAAIEQLSRRVANLSLSLGFPIKLASSDPSAPHPKGAITAGKLQFLDAPHTLSADLIHAALYNCRPSGIIASLESNDRIGQMMIRANIIATRLSFWSPGLCLGWGYTVTHFNHEGGPNRQKFSKALNRYAKALRQESIGFYDALTKSSLQPLICETRIASDGIILVCEYRLQWTSKQEAVLKTLAEMLANQSAKRTSIWLSGLNGIVVTQVLANPDVWAKEPKADARMLIIGRKLSSDAASEDQLSGISSAS